MEIESKDEIDQFLFLKIKRLWGAFKEEHFSFWMLCCYLFFEYARPQAIFPIIDFLPWAQLFLIGALIGAVLDKSVKWVNAFSNVLIVIFAIAILVSSITAYYPEVSRKYYIDFYSWFVVYFLIITIVNTKIRFYIFCIIFLICAAKISIGTSKAWIFRGFSFTTWGLMGPKGYFQNSGELAILMLTLFPIAYLLQRYARAKIGKFENFILVVFWITPILTILGASSRGAQIALVLLLLMLFRKSVFRVKYLIAILCFSLVLYQLLPEEQKQRFETTGEDRSSQQRILYWTHGMEMIKAHPYFGVGYFNFPEYYAAHFPEDMLYPHAELPHNIFIQVGTDAGFFALIPFFLLIGYVFLKGVAASRDGDIISILVVGFSYGVFGYFIAGQFVSVAYYPFLWIGLAFVVAGSNIKRKMSIER